MRTYQRANVCARTSKRGLFFPCARVHLGPALSAGAAIVCWGGIHLSSARYLVRAFACTCARVCVCACVRVWSCTLVRAFVSVGPSISTGLPPISDKAFPSAAGSPAEAASASGPAHAAEGGQLREQASGADLPAKEARDVSLPPLPAAQGLDSFLRGSSAATDDAAAAERAGGDGEEGTEAAADAAEARPGGGADRSSGNVVAVKGAIARESRVSPENSIMSSPSSIRIASLALHTQHLDLGSPGDAAGAASRAHNHRPGSSLRPLLQLQSAAAPEDNEGAPLAAGTQAQAPDAESPPQYVSEFLSEAAGPA